MKKFIQTSFLALSILFISPLALADGSQAVVKVIPKAIPSFVKYKIEEGMTISGICYVHEQEGFVGTSNLREIRGPDTVIDRAWIEQEVDDTDYCFNVTVLSYDKQGKLKDSKTVEINTECPRDSGECFGSKVKIIPEYTEMRIN